jgi:hypothetical protein
VLPLGTTAEQRRDETITAKTYGVQSVSDTDADGVKVDELAAANRSAGQKRDWCRVSWSKWRRIASKP